LLFRYQRIDHGGVEEDSLFYTVMATRSISFPMSSMKINLDSLLKRPSALPGILGLKAFHGNLAHFAVSNPTIRNPLYLFSPVIYTGLSPVQDQFSDAPGLCQ
jgi:hypothetical protein